MVHVANDESKEGKNTARIVIDATAGAIAGCIARIIIGPLDVIKIRFQVQLEPIMVSGINNIISGSNSSVGGGSSGPGSVARQSKYTGFGQALKTIVREEGIQGLWRGTVPGLLLTVPYTAVQFVALQQVRQQAAAYGLTANPSSAPLVSLASGALAGAAATVASYPFDLLRTTLAAQGEPRVYGNMWDAARGIVTQRGPVGLYSGLGVTLMEIMPYAALQFGLYDALDSLANETRLRYQRDLAMAALVVTSSDTFTAPSGSAGATDSNGPCGRSRYESGGGGPGRNRDDRRGSRPSDVSLSIDAASASHPSLLSSSATTLEPSRLQAFACGLVAGLVAKLVTHPLDVAKKRYQVAGLQRSLSYGARVDAGFVMRSLAESLAHIYRTEGLLGLWKGSVPSIVKAAPSAAITFAAYDAVLAWLLQVAEQQPGQQQGTGGAESRE